MYDGDCCRLQAIVFLGSYWDIFVEAAALEQHRRWRRRQLEQAAAARFNTLRSLATILPFGPEPLIPFKEIPFSKAIVLANGDAIILSVGAF